MKYNDFTIGRILEAIRSGSGRVAACEYADISYETFTRWMEFPEFYEQILRAEAEKNERIKESCVQRILKASDGDWRAAAWMAERKFPVEFGRRVEVVDKAREWGRMFETVSDDNPEAEASNSVRQST